MCYTSADGMGTRKKVNMVAMISGGREETGASALRRRLRPQRFNARTDSDLCGCSRTRPEDPEKLIQRPFGDNRVPRRTTSDDDSASGPLVSEDISILSVTATLKRRVRVDSSMYLQGSTGRDTIIIPRSGSLIPDKSCRGEYLLVGKQVCRAFELTMSRDGGRSVQLACKRGRKGPEVAGMAENLSFTVTRGTLGAEYSSSRCAFTGFTRKLATSHFISRNRTEEQENAPGAQHSPDNSITPHLISDAHMHPRAIANPCAQPPMKPHLLYLTSQIGWWLVTM